MFHFWIRAFEGEEVVTETPSEPMFTQAQLNEINKKERLRREAAEKANKDKDELINQLRNQHQMTEEEKNNLNARLEELETAKLTDQEKRELEIKKLQEKYEADKKSYEERLNATTKDYHNVLITRGIKEAALEGPVVAADGTGDQVYMVLRSQATVNEKGEVIIKDFYWEDGDKNFTEDLTVKEAVSKMKEMNARWGNFWKDPANPGFVDPFRGSPPGPLKLEGLTQEEYRRRRAKGEIPHALNKG